MDIWMVMTFITGLVLLVVGAEVMVSGAARLAAAVGISSLVIGLTVVAFGTSSPELAVSLQSSFQGQAGIAVGNVIGSNIFNILFILGISAIITPLLVDQQLIRLDVPLLIGVSIVSYLFMQDGALSRWEGSTLFVGLLCYITFLIWTGKSQDLLLEPETADQSQEHQPKPLSDWRVNVLFVVGGIGMLILGSRLLVNAAVSIAQAFGISDVVIGITVVAVGTSMPEVATSVVAALRGQRDIAVGNVVGSNLFNLMAVMGLTAVLSPTSVPIPSTILVLDLPFMVIVAVACLPIFFTGNLIARWEGILFLAYYITYTAYLIITATAPNRLGSLESAVVYFLVPLTVITIVVTVYGEVRSRRQRVKA